MSQLYRDPTLEEAQRMEIREKKCEACVRRMPLSTGDLRCGVNKSFPRCKQSRDGRGHLDGFKLDEGIDHGAAANE